MSEMNIKEDIGNNGKTFNLNFHLSKGSQNKLELNSNTNSSK